MCAYEVTWFGIFRNSFGGTYFDPLGWFNYSACVLCVSEVKLKKWHLSHWRKHSVSVCGVYVILAVLVTFCTCTWSMCLAGWLQVYYVGAWPATRANSACPSLSGQNEYCCCCSPSYHLASCCPILSELVADKVDKICCFRWLIP